MAECVDPSWPAGAPSLPMLAHLQLSAGWRLFRGLQALGSGLHGAEGGAKLHAASASGSTVAAVQRQTQTPWH